MARLPRLCLPGIPHHLIQRGVNRQPCFVTDTDYAAYAHWLDEYAKKYSVAIHAWVFMTNHVHLLATPASTDGISLMMQSLGRKYVRYFNHKHERTGTLWEGRFRSCVIHDEKYLLTCQRYIELNPVRAEMVDAPEQYLWSSYHANALGKPIALWTPHTTYLQLGKLQNERLNAYRALFDRPLTGATLTQIREAVSKGLALGDASFKASIEETTGRRVSPAARGPKPRAKEEFLL